jgi:enoyl reductase-like protein
MAWLEFGKDWFQSDLIFAVRRVGKGKTQTTIFPVGASPVDGGYLVQVPTAEVMDRLRQARTMELVDLLNDDADADADAEEVVERAEREPEPEPAEIAESEPLEGDLAEREAEPSESAKDVGQYWANRLRHG